MGWSAIIAAILQAVGPLIVEWVKKWLESLLQQAAATVDDNGEPLALLRAAHDMVPRRAFARRALLRMMMHHSEQLATGALAPEAAEDVRTAGFAAGES